VTTLAGGGQELAVSDARLGAMGHRQFFPVSIIFDKPNAHRVKIQAKIPDKLIRSFLVGHLLLLNAENTRPSGDRYQGRQAVFFNGFGGNEHGRLSKLTGRVALKTLLSFFDLARPTWINKRICPAKVL
jgi:hypothetical protein